MPPGILVTAGPTREYLDPVRFLSNPSSGKMGYYIAEEARRRGFRTLLIAGPCSLPEGPLRKISVNSARELHKAVRRYFGRFDVLVMTAAVCDYRPATCRRWKIKKSREALEIRLTPNPDILAWAGRRKMSKLLIGFAAETDHVIENAREKMIRKNLDAIVANRVGRCGAGFDSDSIDYVLLDNSQPVPVRLRRRKKQSAAKEIVDFILYKLKTGKN